MEDITLFCSTHQNQTVEMLKVVTSGIDAQLRTFSSFFHLPVTLVMVYLYYILQIQILSFQTLQFFSFNWLCGPRESHFSAMLTGLLWDALSALSDLAKTNYKPPDSVHSLKVVKILSQTYLLKNILKCEIIAKS